MTTKIIYSFSLAILFTACNQIKTDQFFTKTTKINSSGSLIDKTFDLDFDGIKVTSGIDAEVIKSNEEKVVITAPSDVMEAVSVEKNGDVLEIRFKSGYSISNPQVSAKIYAKDFSKISASSIGSIKLKDKFTQDKTDIQVSSSGDISGNLEANKMKIQASSSGSFSGQIWAIDLDADASSSGEINISGKSNNANIDVSSSGSVGGDFITDTADLQASSSGSIQIAVTKSLEASASSGGDINVSKKGSIEKVNNKESSGGRIRIR